MFIFMFNSLKDMQFFGNNIIGILFCLLLFCFHYWLSGEIFAKTSSSIDSDGWFYILFALQFPLEVFVFFFKYFYHFTCVVWLHCWFIVLCRCYFYFFRLFFEESKRI
uniref:(northern house mosquito) hypothetical protein n=1 Tax=Culex pipiens TaxID=7175 RepID=A0A8D8N0T2_CULPI